MAKVGIPELRGSWGTGGGGAEFFPDCTVVTRQM